MSIFEPLGDRYQGQSLAQSNVTNENGKKLLYNEIVLEWGNGTFTREPPPLYSMSMEAWVENAKYSTSSYQACWRRTELTNIHWLHHGFVQKHHLRYYGPA